MAHCNHEYGTLLIFCQRSLSVWKIKVARLVSYPAFPPIQIPSPVPMCWTIRRTYLPPGRSVGALFEAAGRIVAVLSSNCILQRCPNSTLRILEWRHENMGQLTLQSRETRAFCAQKLGPRSHLQPSRPVQSKNPGNVSTSLQRLSWSHQGCLLKAKTHSQGKFACSVLTGRFA